MMSTDSEMVDWEVRGKNDRKKLAKEAILWYTK